jgi:hypothetical protein
LLAIYENTEKVRWLLGERPGLAYEARLSQKPALVIFLPVNHKIIKVRNFKTGNSTSSAIGLIINEA